MLRDSQAILVWVKRKYGNDSWIPSDPDEEALVNAWLSAAAYEIRLGPYDARLAKLFPWLCVMRTRCASAATWRSACSNDRLIAGTGSHWITPRSPTSRRSPRSLSVVTVTSAWTAMTPSKLGWLGSARCRNSSTSSMSLRPNFSPMVRPAAGQAATNAMRTVTRLRNPGLPLRMRRQLTGAEPP